ncbi:unnamed protein product, partial [Mesorhabditis spiculigera]
MPVTASGAALLFSGATLIISLLAAASIYGDVTELWKELDTDIARFKLETDTMWSDLVQMGAGTASNRLRRQTQNYGGYGATGQQHQPSGGYGGYGATPGGGPTPSFSTDEQPGGPSVGGPPDCVPGTGVNGVPCRPNFPGSFGGPFTASGRLCQCNAQNSCPAGPAGPVGDAGPDGLDGIDGQDGKDGQDADDVQQHAATGCFNCPQGPPGQQGPSGSPGIRGMRGARGQPGSPGRDAEKPVARQGPRGIPGDAGVEGPAGDKGQDAPQGKEGPIGEPGVPGYQGAAGADGEEGREGPSGSVGKDAEYCRCPERENGFGAGTGKAATFEDSQGGRQGGNNGYGGVPPRTGYRHI